MNIKELDEQILKLCEKGRTVDAVRLYKDVMDAGLAESKNYVDNLIENLMKNQPETKNSLENQVITLIKKGQKLQAVKLYLDNTGCSLMQAKNYVDVLAEKL